jgi:hypothetical protein
VLEFVTEKSYNYDEQKCICLFRLGGATFSRRCDIVHLNSKK